MYDSYPSINFYTIKADTLEVTPFDILPTLKQEGLLVILEISKDNISWNTNGNYYKAFNGKIKSMNIDGSEAGPLVNNLWKFDLGGSTRYGVGTNNTSNFIANFVDPYGLIMSEVFSITPEGFIEAYKRFMILSTFPNINSEKLALLHEKEKLKQFIIRLEAEVNLLKP